MTIDAARMLTEAIEASRPEEEVIVELLNLAKHRQFLIGSKGKAEARQSSDRGHYRARRSVAYVGLSSVGTLGQPGS